jgi:ubiquinone/menaquinone biosynthesis C-methylase UbiE
VLTRQHEQWLQDTRRFWDAGTLFEAKYRRICSDLDIDATSDERELESLWEKRTTDELAHLLDSIPLQSDWTCLEIGCGLGRLLKPIARRCRKAIGVDLSHEMIAFGRDYLSDVTNAELHVNDGRTLSGIPDESIDLVYSHLAFQHMTLCEVVESYLTEIVRVLKPDGYCRIQCWREAEMPAVQRLKNIARATLQVERYHGPRCWKWLPGREVRFGGVTFHPRQWRRLLARHGLRVVSMQLGLGHDYWMWTTSRRK